MMIVKAILDYIKVFGLFNFLYIAIQKLFNKRMIHFYVKGLKYPLSLRVNTMDLSVYRQIFYHNELDIGVTLNAKVIIDAGGNVGYSALYFLKKYPQARIISIEPEKTNIEIFKINTSKYSNISLIEGAVWNKSTNLVITNPEGRSDSFIVHEDDEKTENSISAFSITDILKTSNVEHIDILKIDIEGAEKDLFSSNVESWITKVKVLMLEYHDRFREGCTKTVEHSIKDYVEKKLIVGEYHIYFLKQDLNYGS